MVCAGVDEGFGLRALILISKVGFTWIWSDWAGFFPGWVGPNLKARDFRAWQPAAGNFGQAQN